jgi:hypothetical protein
MTRQTAILRREGTAEAITGLIPDPGDPERDGRADRMNPEGNRCHRG